VSESFINLLIVDRSPSDAAERILEVLRSAGFTVQELLAEREAEIHDSIQYKPIDLIMVRQGESLPKIAEIRALADASAEEITILAIVENAVQQSVVDSLRAGADNFFYLAEPEHLLLTVRKELHHVGVRREARSLETKHRESEGRCYVLLQSSPEGIAYIHEGAHIYANPAYLKLFGYVDDKDMEGITLMNLVIPDDRDKLKTFLRLSTKAGQSPEPLELTGLDRNGLQFPLAMECMLTSIDEEPCLQIRIHNPVVTQVEKRATDGFGDRDELTGLYNRKHFTQHLNQVCAAAREENGAVLYILLTDYRAISEHLGLEGVDLLVADLGRLLQSLLSPQEIIAHFSDAVFTIYTPESVGANVLQFGERIAEAVKSHVTNAARKLVNTASAIGICMVQKTHENAMQILSQVDRVCEIARQVGDNQVQIYPPLGGPEESQQEERISSLVRGAMSGERISLLFQPIASFQSSVTERYKAYLRILGEDKKPLPMSTFGAVAESRGLMGPLDKWVISRGLKIVSDRLQKTSKLATLFVRVSQNSVTAEDFGDWLAKLLKDINLQGDALVIEVTEQCAEKCLMETKRLREKIQELRCGFALSHCSGRPNSERLLNYLFPDYIKLDGSLIEKLAKGKDEESHRSIAHLTEQAQVRKTLVVAAEVATAPQMASIWQFGVALVQGDMVQQASPHMDFDFQQFVV
jgi:diguanylate cyclase (GGDEF)-like protein/PAS domain S-box-containing protein